MTRPPISFIVLNYNGKAVLPRTLEAIRRFASAKDEVIVVDNDSADGSAGLAKKSGRVRVLKLKRNKVMLGFNDGVSAARNELVGLFNNDFVLQNADFDRAASILRDPSVFGVSAKTVFRGGTLDFGPVSAKCTLGFFRLDIRGRGKPASQEFLNEEVPHFSAPVAGIYSRKKFIGLGGFDESFLPAYWEEIDLAYRAMKRGWKIVYSPSIEVLHNQENRVVRTFGKSVIARTSNRNKHLFIWRNFSSPRLLVPYALSLPFVFLAGLVSTGPAFVLGFLDALKRLGGVLAWKGNEERKRKKSDEEIFSLTNGSIFP